MNTPSAVLDGTRTPVFGSASLHDLLRRWLPAQRWYAGRGRITAVTVVAATELTPDCQHLVVRITEDPGENDAYYQLFLGAAADPAPRLRQHVLGRVHAPGGRDLLLYDAVHDQRVAVLLLDRIRRGGSSGHLRFESFPRVAVPAGLTPRVVGTEQSNTSIVYGDTLILKLFRRIRPGINPDLEVPTALARSGYARVPAPTAWFFSTSPFWGTLGMVQPFIPRATDGWTLALRSASARGDFAEQAHSLGRTTAELHTALARAFPVRDPEPHHLPCLIAEMTRRLVHGAEAIPALRRHAAGLRGIYAAASAAGDLPLQRLHGDLHLGQVLHAQGQWHVVDFEGEPAQPMAERRSDRSPLRDVVGMLRSFDYAGHMGAPEDPEWAERCRSAFRTGYGESGGFEPDSVPALLRAYEADRAVYEVLYEAAHRPEWIDVPLRAVARLVATAA
ncbi:MULTISPECIES: phosphotransferase [unclassified Streptomyces]|uniref:maltokinase N-terminal cap-like domain-containing protein n=1 Tax=unclassified Streptomyces TaxID=2593676 RepID=UPI000DB99CB5|nr:MULTISPECIES: phosphotransferase [unclassified Streptomyces]MYT73383.1 phosphotransferase [Streptomyces sp. SID8367]RAJ67259.1 maltokinase [Streptomyces sp. PsTaAH-137]